MILFEASVGSDFELSLCILDDGHYKSTFINHLCLLPALHKLCDVC